MIQAQQSSLFAANLLMSFTRPLERLIIKGERLGESAQINIPMFMLLLLSPGPPRRNLFL